MGGLPTRRTVNGFAVNPTDPKVMYVAARDGLFQSRDGGESWTAVGKGLRNMAAVAVNPKRPAEVFAATEAGLIYRSTDAGRTWKPQRSAGRPAGMPEAGGAAGEAVGRRPRRRRDIERAYPRRKFIETLRRLADALERQAEFRIQAGGERVRIPAGAVISIEHERGRDEEEVEFQTEVAAGAGLREAGQ